MKIARHFEKIGKLNELRGRLEPLDDFELWFWAGMTAGTHAVNAALHHAQITGDADMFATQPGVYLVQQPDGSLRAAFRPLGDVLHVGRPNVEGPIPADIAAMMHDMEIVEKHRDPCVRGRQVPTLRTVQECEEALTECFQLLDKRTTGEVS